MSEMIKIKTLKRVLIPSSRGVSTEIMPGSIIEISADGASKLIKSKAAVPAPAGMKLMGEKMLQERRNIFAEKLRKEEKARIAAIKAMNS